MNHRDRSKTVHWTLFMDFRYPHPQSCILFCRYQPKSWRSAPGDLLSSAGTQSRRSGGWSGVSGAMGSRTVWCLSPEAATLPLVWFSPERLEEGLICEEVRMLFLAPSFYQHSKVHKGFRGKEKQRWKQKSGVLNVIHSAAHLWVSAGSFGCSADSLVAFRSLTCKRRRHSLAFSCRERGAVGSVTAVLFNLWGTASRAPPGSSTERHTPLCLRGGLLCDSLAGARAGGFLQPFHLAALPPPGSTGIDPRSDSRSRGRVSRSTSLAPAITLSL